MTREEATATFTAERQRLLGIAHRVLTRKGEAEDIVQDAWLRWERYDWRAVDNPAAFLATTTTRLAINATKTAHARRELSGLPHLPEPVDTGDDPTLGTERAEALEMALLVVFEDLTPTERAAYVLREAFDYPYDRIAAVVGSTVVNARQLVSRARRRIGDDRQAPTDIHRRRALLEAFLDAARRGELDTLEEVLRHDI